MRRSAAFNPYYGVEKSRLLGSSSVCYVFFHDDGTPVVTASGSFMFCLNESKVQAMLVKASEKRYRPADITKLSPSDAAKVQRLRELFPPPGVASTAPPPQPAPSPQPAASAPPPRQAAPPPRRPVTPSEPAIPEIEIGYYHAEVPGDPVVLQLKDVIARILRDVRANVHMVWKDGMADWEDALAVPMIARILQAMTQRGTPPPSSPPPSAQVRPEAEPEPVVEPEPEPQSEPDIEPEPEYTPSDRKRTSGKYERMESALRAYREKKPRFGLSLSGPIKAQPYGDQRQYTAEYAFNAPLLETINVTDTPKPFYHPVDVMRLLDRNNADAFPIIEKLFFAFVGTRGNPTPHDVRIAQALEAELFDLRALSPEVQRTPEKQERFRMIHYEMSDVLRRYANNKLPPILALMSPGKQLRTNPRKNRFYR